MIYTLEAGDGGIAADLDGMDVADRIWTAGKNARFEGGYFQPFDGHVRLYDPPTVTPYGVFPLRTTAANLWVYAGLAKAYAVNTSGTHFNITRTTGGDYTATASTKWTGSSLTSFLIFNNENDVPQSWNGDTGTAAANLANWTSTHRCKSIRALRNYLVAVNITKSTTNYPMMVKWSHAANPGALPDSWNEADATKDAGEHDLGDANGYLVDMVPLGDMGIIYSTGAYHAMQYVGGTFVWRFTRLNGDVGAISQNCVAQYPGGHVVLAGGDVFTHAGGQPRSIIDRRMRRSLFNSMDSTNYLRSFIVHNEARAEVWICIPEGGASFCNKAYVWNYAQDSWGLRDLPNCAHGNLGPVVNGGGVDWDDETGTWDSSAGPWDGSSIEANRRRVVMAGNDGRLFLMDAGLQFDNLSTQEMYVERTGLSMDNPAAVKLIKSVRPRVDAATGTTLTVQVGSSMTPDGSITWSGSPQYIVGTTHKVNMLGPVDSGGAVAGRFLAVKVKGGVGATSPAWRCRSLDIEYEVVGYE